MADNMEGLGTMLSFLGQGSNAGGAEPLPDSGPPSGFFQQPQAPQAQQPGGSGILKGILGNLASSYVTNKLQTHMDNADAKEQGAQLSGVITEQLKATPKDSPFHEFLTNNKRLVGSSNPALVKAGLKAYGDYTSSVANNLQTTAEQKNVADPKVMEMQTRKDNVGSIPAGMTRDAQGNLQYSPMVTGGNYGDVIAQRALEQRMAVTPVQAKQLELAQASSDRAEKRSAIEDARYERSLIKEIPANHRASYTGNLSSINQIDEALKAVQERPESFGLKMIGGDKINQRLDPEGTKYRAAISQIASAKRHDISGAAVSPTEDKYLQPFLPNETDTPEAIQKKLLTLREQYANTNNEIGSIYKEGYRGQLPAIPKDPITLQNEAKQEAADKALLNADQEAAYQNYLKGRK